VPLIVSELLILSSYFSSIDLVQSSFQALVPLGAQFTTIVSIFAQSLPLFLLAVSLYGLFTLRPALMVTMLTVLLLILTSVIGRVDEYLAGLVVASSFLSLVGFSHARAAKVLRGRRLRLDSHGPFIFKLTTTGLDLLLPVASALGVMAIIAYVMGIIRSQVAILPQPVSTLGTLYLESHVYLVMTILAVAGGAVWAIRAFIEPIILRFTLTPADAREMAYGEVRDIYSKIVRESSKRPSRGRAPFILFTTVLAVTVTLLVLTIGPSQSINELLAAIGLSRVTPSHSELLTGNIAENTARLVNQYFATAENILKMIIHLLWG